MSKRVSDLNEVKAQRARNSGQSPEPQRPRLAERLVALAPLARAPLVAEPEPEAGELSRLSDARRFGHRDAVSSNSSGNALVLQRPAALPRLQETARLSRVGDFPPLDVHLDRDPTTPDSATVVSFLVGLSIASAIGLALYALLA